MTIALPKPGLIGLKENWRYDLLAGFQVFLIALPLCLGIAMASRFPPMAGITAAIVGGLLVSRINGSYVTISGPAAGLIVVTLGAVESLGQGDPLAGYHRALAAIVCAGILQVLLGILRAGRFVALVPASVVHGMLAAIGVIIMIKQTYVLIDVQPQGELLENLAALPQSLTHANPEIAAIGLTGLLILILWEPFKSRLPLLQWVPAPIVVVAVGLLMGLAFDLEHPHKYSWHSTFYAVDPEELLPVPQNFWDGFAFPDFSLIDTAKFWLAVVSICLVSSLETLLSAAAVDKLDPFQRQSDLNRDVAALGIGTAVSGALGGLPMISEIVRSTANINFGARTQWSNFFHGLFLLLFVTFFPRLIHEIPKAALASLLIFVGYKLASPKEFYKTWEIGKEQLFLFVFTILAVLATDLLIGVGLGICTKVAIHLLRGVSPKELFKLAYRIEPADPDAIHVAIDGAAVFSNFLALKSALANLPKGKTLIFDLTNASFIDHTVMEFLHEFCHDYQRTGGCCQIRGLELHEPVSSHPLAARRKSQALLGAFLEMAEHGSRLEIRLKGKEVMRQVQIQVRQALQALPPDKKVYLDLSEAELPEPVIEEIKKYCLDHGGKILESKSAQPQLRKKH